MSKRLIATGVILGFVILLGLGATAAPGKAQLQPTPAPFFQQYSRPMVGVDEIPPAINRSATEGPFETPIDPEIMEPTSDFWAYLQWSPVVYQAYVDDNWELYTTRGHDIKRLTYTDTAEANPDLNNAANRIAFNSNMNGSHDIFVINLDGSGLMRLTAIENSSEYDPAWSPDGRKIAYVSRQNGSSDIYVMNSDGSGAARLTYSPDSDFGPTWSPDGKKIAYVHAIGDFGQIRIMNADGSAPKAVTEQLRYLAHPAWSPNGNYIAYDADDDGDFFNEVKVRNLETGEDSGVYINGQVGPIDYFAGNWSHNGDWLTFSQLTYELFDGYYYLVHSIINMTPTDSPFIHCITSVDYAMSPDAQSLDPFLPVSQMNPLPQYSRASPYTISLQGQDYGLSGISYFDWDYRIAEAGEWNHLYLLGGKSGTFSEPSCEQIYFRVRGIDKADNYEAWPVSPDWDATTRQFNWYISGKVVDSRNVPLGNSSMSISPTLHPSTSDDSGLYFSRMCDSSTTLISAAREGYGSFGPVTRSIKADTRVDLYLPPSDDVIINGGFEGAVGLNGWITEGTLSTGISNGYSEVQSARLGKDCGGMCLTDPQLLFSSSYNSDTFKIIEDSHKNLHVLSSRYFYRMRNSQGEWGNIVTLPKPAGDYGAMGMEMEIDGQDTLHVLLKGSDNNHYYYTKPLGGAWTYITFPGMKSAQLAVTQAGDVYIPYFVHSSTLAFYVMRKPAGGTWSTPVLLMPNISSYKADVVVEKKGEASIYLVYPGYTYTTIKRFVLRSNGQINEETLNTYFPGSVVDNFSAHITKDQTTILLFGQTYIYKELGGEWSHLVEFPEGITGVSSIVDKEGKVRVSGVRVASLNEIVLYSSRPGQLWIRTGFFLNSAIHSSYNTGVNIGENGEYQVVWLENDKVYFRESTSAGQAENGALRQTVTLPALHQPTLAFRYFTENLSSRFDVSITDNQGNTTVFEQPLSLDWKHRWIDLTPWNSQEIVVSFNLHQESDTQYNTLFLDDVSLGSWLTPVILGITPGDLKYFSGDLITIAGENFLDGASVLLDGIPVPGVTYQDENTLFFNLPNDIEIGSYDVTVRNPGGQSSVRSAGLLLGWSTSLPLLRK